MATAQSPIKVNVETKEKIRIAAAMLGRNQSELVERAVTEYVQRHAEEFQLGLKHAREALALGAESAIGYLAGEDPETVARLGGSSKRTRSR